MIDNGNKTLGEILFDEGLVEQEQFEAAKAIHENTGMSIAAALVETGAISDAAKNTLLKKKFGIEAVVIEAEKRDESLMKLIPRREAARHRVIPLRVENDALLIAMEEPNSLLLTEYLRTLTGYRITPVAASYADVERALKGYPDEERRAGIRMHEKPFIVRAIVSLISTLVYVLLPLAVGFAILYDVGDLQNRLVNRDAYEIFLLVFLSWGAWILVVWYIQGLIFIPKDSE